MELTCLVDDQVVYINYLVKKKKMLANQVDR